MRVEEIATNAGFRAVADTGVPALDEALRRLCNDDKVLLSRGAHERTICHRLATYLECALNRDRDASQRWHVDCEYNLFGSDASDHARHRTVDELRKYLPVQGRDALEGDEKEHSVFPDIVVHRRDEPDNELVLEVKVVRGTPKKTEIEYDLRKLRAFADGNKGFSYRRTLFIAITPSPDASTSTVEVFAPVGGVA